MQSLIEHAILSEYTLLLFFVVVGGGVFFNGQSLNGLCHEHQVD